MKTLSIVIPVYNEEDRLDRTFQALSELRLSRGLKLEKVIFVDDGSTDDTKRIIERFLDSSTIGGVPPGHPRGVLIAYKSNKGKGYAISQGMKESESDYTLFCDADISTPLSEIKKFLPYFKKNTPIIIGTRKNGVSTVIRHQPLVREFLGHGFTLLSNLVLDTSVTDFTCGFKAFSREAKEAIFPKLTIKGWGFDAQVLYLAKIFKLKTTEVPVIWSDDRRSKVKLWKDLPISLYELIAIRASQPPTPSFSFVQTIKSLIF